MDERLKLIGFDIEISKPFPDGEGDWKIHRPLGISCAATIAAGESARLWYGRTPGADYAAQMSPGEVQELVRYLQSQVEAGGRILTWNGLGFDFDILAEESGMGAECASLALGHVDMMFHVFCLKGFPLGLDKAAQGMGLAGKTPGITGDMVPGMWQAGRYVQVLEYVQQDVQTLLDLWFKVDGLRQLKWFSNRGYPQRLDLPRGWLTVEQADKLPSPDTSWMSNPWPRTKFTGWVEKYK